MPTPLAMGSVIWNHFADGLGQQVACNARQDHDGTRQGLQCRQNSAATSMLMAVVTDLGRRVAYCSGQAQRQRQGQCTAQADQRAHRDARNDGGGVLLEQIPLS